MFVGLGITIDGSGAPASSFSPTDGSISGLTLWLPSDAAQFTTVGGDGTATSQWNDVSGNSRHFTATTTQRPTYRATGSPSSTPCLEFNGTTNQMVTTATLGQVLTASAWTVFYVFKLLAVPTSNSGSAAAYNNPAVIGDFSVGDYWGETVQQTGPTLHSYHYDGASKSATGTIANTTWYRVRSQFNGSTITQRIGASAATTAAAGNIQNTTGTMCLGRNGASTAFLNYQLAEVLAYNRSLTAGEIGTIDSWLSARFAGL
jgi:hypothetical protein